MTPPRTPRALPVPDSQDANLQAIDLQFEQAGLVRNLPGDAPTPFCKRWDRAQPEGLTRPAHTPTVAANGAHWLAVAGWEKFPWLWHGFSTRKGGVSRAYCADNAPGELNLGFTDADSRDAVAANRRLLAEAVTGSSATPMIAIRQIHSNLVVRATAADQFRERPWKADGHIADEPGLLLGVQTADCIPVLVADRKRRAVGAFHAGWRGTVKRIVESGVGRMRLEFGSRPEDMVAAIGPGIGPCCYAIGDEVLSSFESQFAYADELFREIYDTDEVRAKYPMLFLTQRAPGHAASGLALHVDLVEANRRQLLDAGLKPRSIQVVNGCTSCQPDLFFSHRASKGHAGRMLSVIGIRP